MSLIYIVVISQVYSIYLKSRNYLIEHYEANPIPTSQNRLRFNPELFKK